MKRKIFVISADAMTGDDIKKFKELDAYKKYLSGGAEVKEMRSIYPALTYPAHATLATGVFPDKHGILANWRIDPCNPDPDQSWYYEDFKVKDIFTGVKEKGYTTGTVNWTSMGNNPSIDYLIDECWVNSQYTTVPDVFRAMGSSEDMIKIIKAHMPDFDYQPKNPSWHPGAEQLIVDCTKDIMRCYHPDFMMIHISNIDGYKHSNGITGPLLEKGIREMSDWLCEIFETIDVDNTNIFMLSDHGQLEYSRCAHLNTLFRGKGWISCMEGKITAWKVFAASSGHSAYIVLKDPDDHILEHEVGEFLHSLCETGLHGISEVFSNKQAEERYRLGGRFAYIVEGDGYTKFADTITDSYITVADTDYRVRHGAHGYEPEKGPQPFVLAKGPDIREGVEIEHCMLVDIAPTLAYITGAVLPDTDGTPLFDLLIKGEKT